MLDISKEEEVLLDLMSGDIARGVHKEMIKEVNHVNNGTENESRFAHECHLLTMNKLKDAYRLGRYTKQLEVNKLKDTIDMLTREYLDGAGDLYLKSLYANIRLNLGLRIGKGEL